MKFLVHSRFFAPSIGAALPRSATTGPSANTFLFVVQVGDALVGVTTSGSVYVPA
jgi:hypothetical protein